MLCSRKFLATIAPWRHGIARAAALTVGLLAASAASATGIGLQFLVDRSTAEHVDRREIERMVDELNATFARSDVALVARLRRVAVLDFGSRDALRLLEQMHAGSGPFADLHAMADAFGADFTVALSEALELRGEANCGRAYAVNRTPAELADPTRAVAVIRPRCGSHTLAHELGHLMGLNHGGMVDACSPGRGHARAVTPYANGYGIGNCDGRPQPGEFGTLMVGGWMRVVNGERLNRLEVFSNPRLSHPLCGQARRCGDPETGDAARALEEHAAIYAGHAEPDADRLTYADPALARCIARDHRGREVAELERLRCNDSDLVSLEGMEQLVALREVDLAGTAITSLAPLRALPPGRLRRIDLSGTARLACTEVATLDGLLADDARLVPPKRCRR